VSRLAPEIVREITRRLLAGESRREISRALRTALATVRAIADRTPRPPCPCGKRHGHKGWCAFRLARAPRRQQFLKVELPARNKCVTRKGVRFSAAHRAALSAATIGVPHKGTPEEIAQCKAQPLSIRRWHQRARLALQAAVRLDRPFFEDAIVRDFFFADLIQPEPSPLQRLIEKEEHAEWELTERRFWLWRKACGN